jgi:peptidoglycan hydrolase-like protein with peptidoglycan-binding domain
MLLAGTVIVSPASSQPAPAPAQTSDLTPQPLTYVQVLGPAALRAVQERLHANGTFTGQVDGNWGPDSQAALERFQQSSGLQVTGQLNQATVTVLGINPAVLVSTASAAQPPPAGPVPGHQIFALSDGSIRLIQGRLRTYGFYYGGIDGEWGYATQVAMQNFQQARGIPVTDHLNAATVSALGLDPASMSPAD